MLVGRRAFPVFIPRDPLAQVLQRRYMEAGENHRGAERNGGGRVRTGVEKAPRDPWVAQLFIDTLGIDNQKATKQGRRAVSIVHV